MTYNDQLDRVIQVAKYLEEIGVSASEAGNVLTLALASWVAYYIDPDDHQGMIADLAEHLESAAASFNREDD